MSAAPPVRIAMVGCGAIAERGHLPAIGRTTGAALAMCVDADPRRAAAMAERFGGAAVATSTAELNGTADAAIVAVPHAHHAAVCCELLARGVHVLVEKPMATTAADCDRMLAAAEAGGAMLAVGLMRRQLASAQLAKRVVASGMLGKITRFDLREGGAYTWPAASDAFLRRDHSGGGVLLDTGAHVLDALLCWLGEVEHVAYRDDAEGGVEADCEVELEMANGAHGLVVLSRLRALRNTAILVGERGELEVGLRTNQATLRLAGEAPACLTGEAGTGGPAPPSGFPGFVAAQLADFVAAIRGRRPPAVSGHEGRRSVALIERCYRERRPLRPSWAAPGPRAPASPLTGKRVLVTGGTGFLGGRLVERLLAEHGAEVRVLARDVRRATRLARLPVELWAGDAADSAEVTRAASGCDLIVHCAFDFGGGPEGMTRQAERAAHAVCDAAVTARVRRVVHVGSISSYGATADGDLDETAAPAPVHPYARAKHLAETAALARWQRDGVPVVVVQPTIVYGPYSKPWTLGPVEQLRSGEVVLVDGGTGACNAVYVDDVIDGLLAAATQPQVEGQTFLLSGPQPTTWRDFYGAYEAMLGVRRTRAVERDEILRRPATAAPQAGTLAQLRRLALDPRAWRTLSGLPPLRSAYGLVERVSPIDLKSWLKGRLGAGAPAAQGPAEPKVHWPSPERVELCAQKTRVRIDKARRLLGYAPAYDLARGMERTAAFVRWYYDLPAP